MERKAIFSLIFPEKNVRKWDLNIFCEYNLKMQHALFLL